MFYYGDWGLGIGDWGLGPIPNPQIPQSPKTKRFIVRYNKYSDYNKLSFYNVERGSLYKNINLKDCCYTLSSIDSNSSSIYGILYM